MTSIVIKGVQYAIQETIGEGGFSNVYRVAAESGKSYALKKINTLNVEQELIKGFRTEIELMKKLQNEPRVMKYVESEQNNLILYILMELGDVSLAAIINSNTTIPLHMARSYIQEMFLCVDAIHKHGIVHSDLKPENFMLVKNKLKLIDFGLADIPCDNTVNVYRKHAIGTLSYMAPEMFTENTLSLKPNKHSVCASSDVWGCGCIAYEILYGQKLFDRYENRIGAILNPNIKIECPEQGKFFKVPWRFQELVQNCLIRNHALRITVEEALQCLVLNQTYATLDDIKEVVQGALSIGVNWKEGSEDDLERFVEQQLARLTII